MLCSSVDCVLWRCAGGPTSVEAVAHIIYKVPYMHMHMHMHMCMYVQRTRVAHTTVRVGGMIILARGTGGTGGGGGRGGGGEIWDEALGSASRADSVSKSTLSAHPPRIELTPATLRGCNCSKRFVTRVPGSNSTGSPDKAGPISHA
jgi:hypothetical protein